MMKTIAEQVEAWYHQNLEQHKSKFTKIEFGSNHPDYLLRGSTGIGLETPALLASITFWNKGDVAVLGLHKESKTDFIFDDRVLEPGEDIAALLDRYIQEILRKSEPRHR